MWGRDRGHRRGGLAELLGRLHEIDGIAWIRLLYLYPATVDSELIDAMASAAQGLRVHGHAAAARERAGAPARCGARRTASATWRSSIDFRGVFPGSPCARLFIVGFPGETEEHVCRSWRPGSNAPSSTASGSSPTRAKRGTPGAELPQQVPAREKRRRLIRLRDAQRRASERARARRVGQVVQVLVEERRTLRTTDPIAVALRTRSVLTGRSTGEAPGVDGTVAFAGDVPAGAFVDVRLDGNTAFRFLRGRSSSRPHPRGEQVADRRSSAVAAAGGTPAGVSRSRPPAARAGVGATC